MLINGDCLEELKKLKENSVDAVVTDPPYELGFMCKAWDSTGIAYRKDLWREVLRVLKPGGHLLSFGGSRTYHRMACAIEDAGFEIRDQIMWVYGSGFPKSLNIGKAVTKTMGDEDGKVWEGYGTALKPAHEPIVLARKPLSEKTVAENCLKWGVGGLAIDECRVGTETIRINGGGVHNFFPNKAVNPPTLSTMAHKGCWSCFRIRRVEVGLREIDPIIKVLH